MRILFVKRRLDYSSTTSYSMDLATALVRRGERVQICTTGGQLREKFHTLGVETYRAKFNVFSFRKLLGFLQDFGPDLIHVQSLASLPLGRKIARRLQRPYLVTVHRRPGPNAPRVRASQVCGVIAVNEVIREALVNEQDLPKSMIRVIKRGVDLAALKLEPTPDPGPGERRIPVVGSVGRLTPEKGHQTLIAAARRILDGGLEAHFVIVGEGEEERRLRALVKELRLESHVTFCPPMASLSDVYGLFDVVALPVLKSGVGATALEAMAMGKPVIASAVGEMLDLGHDGHTGVLVPEGDAGLLADRIVELLSQPELMAQLGRQARAWVEENFQLDPMVDATRDFYKELLAGLREELELESSVSRRKR